MGSNEGQSKSMQSPANLPFKDYHALSQEILRCANSGISRVNFLEKIANTLLQFSECDAVELQVGKNRQYMRCEASRHAAQSVTFEVIRRKCRAEDTLTACGRERHGVVELCQRIFRKQRVSSSPPFTKRGSFWTGNLKHSLPLALGFDAASGKPVVHGPQPYLSLAIIPLIAEEDIIGLLQLKTAKSDFFQESEIESYERVAQTLGLALVSQQAHDSLRERIKELTCLYSIAQLVEQPDIQLDDILQGVVELLPPAWQYPEITAARIVFDGRCYETAGFQKCLHKQSANLVVKGRQSGTAEVGYIKEKPELDEGPFLKEERSLIDTVVRQIAILVERRKAAEDKSRLKVQLRHADRLATIGQLSAGVAHELNEPLGNILAFAQLAHKEPGIPEQAARDLDKIVTTSLHAREIIKKLMFFARQMPPRKTRVNLNTLVEDGLYLLESRCQKEGVTIVRNLSPNLPYIIADPSQLNQVLVNLVVNAIHAMPEGGSLRIATRVSEKQVMLSVDDNGIGMSAKVLKKIFIPFFTTKDVHEGTGLGLPVVHGIVTSHGGTIAVESTPGQGTRFEIHLPLTALEEETERLPYDASK